MKRSAKALYVLVLVAALGLTACGGGSSASPGGDILLFSDPQMCTGNLNPSGIVIVDGDIMATAIETQDAAGQLQAPQAHQVATGDGILIAVLDGGFNLSAPFLQGRVSPYAYDAIDNDANPDDPGNGIDDNGDGYVDCALGHGTFVAGMALMAAPNATILPIRIANDEGVVDLDALKLGMQYAMAFNADVINLSFEISSAHGAIKNEIEDAEAQGIVLVASAGNDGQQNLGTVAKSKRTITVGAVDQTGTLAPFSNQSGGDRVTVVAPGVDLLGPLGWPDRGTMGIGSGTSFATGIVSGAVALHLEVNPYDTPDAVEQAIAAAVDPAFDTYGFVLPDAGQINLNKVVTQ